MKVPENAAPPRESGRDRCLLRVAGRGLVMLLVGCSTAPEERADPPAWAVQLAAVDPSFGGGDFFEKRLEVFLLSRVASGRKPSRETGDPDVRSRFYSRTARLGASRAVALIRELTDADTAQAGLEFLLSDAGLSYVAAQELALGMQPFQSDRFPAETARTFADPERTGEASRRRIYGPGGIKSALESGSSVSPTRLAIVVASMKITSAQSEGIRSFFASEGGRRYLRVQLAAFPKTAERYQEFRTEAIELGLVDLTTDERRPLLLPVDK